MDRIRKLYMELSIDSGLDKWEMERNLDDGRLAVRMKKWLYTVDFPTDKAEYHKEVKDRIMLAKAFGDDVYVSWCRHRIRHDLFFLAVYILGRTDFDYIEIESGGRMSRQERPFLYDRCVDVQREPDGCIDIWAREHYKSSIITWLKTIQDILVDPEVTICIYSYNITAATKFLEQVKVTLESNAMLIRLFPDILFDNVNQPSWTDEDGMVRQMKWSSEGFVVKRKSNKKEKTLEASGLVVGQKTGGHFDILIYDDVVIPESVTTPEMIEKTTRQFWMSTNTGTTANLRFRIIGTRYHKDDTYHEIISKGFAKPRVWPCIVDGEGVLYDVSALDLKRRGMSEYVWASQMMCDPAIGDTRGFKNDWLQVWQELRLDKLNIYIIVDPAGSTKKRSDRTAMWCVGAGPDSNYYILDLIYDRLDLTGKTNALFSMVKRFTVKNRKPMVYYEKVSMQSDIMHYRYVMNQLSYRFSIVEVTTGNRPKSQRIDTLVPVFRERRIYVPQSIVHVTYDGKQVDMLDQWISEEYLKYPYGKHDDGLDSLAKLTDGSIPITFPDVEDVEDYDRMMLERKGMKFEVHKEDVYDVFAIA